MIGLLLDSSKCICEIRPITAVTENCYSTNPWTSIVGRSKNKAMTIQSNSKIKLRQIVRWCCDLGIKTARIETL